MQEEEKTLKLEKDSIGRVIHLSRFNPPNEIFLQQAHLLILENQKIVAYSKEGVKIYQISNKKITLLSNHKFNLPVNCTNSALICDTKKIRFFIDSFELSWDPSTNQFLEQHDIDPTDPCVLVFESKYRELKPGEVPRVEYLGKFRTKFGGYEGWDVLQSFDTLKPLISDDRLSFVVARKDATKVDSEFIEPDAEENNLKSFFAKITNQSENLFKLVFDFTLDPTKLGMFEDKVHGEVNLVPEYFHVQLEFSLDSTFGKISGDTRTPERYQTFIDIFYKLLILRTMDLRTMKVVKRTIISIFEIFGEYNELLTGLGSKPLIVSKPVYHEDLDVLTLELTIETFFENEMDEDLDYFKSRAGGGGDQGVTTLISRDRYHPFKEKFKIRVEISEVFDTKRRKIVIFPIPNHSIQENYFLGKNKIIFSEENEDQVSLEIKHKTENLKRTPSVGQSQESPGERGLKKTLQKKIELESTKLNILKQDLLNDHQIILSNQRAFELYDEDQAFLMADVRYLLLFDQKSKELISKMKYSECFTDEIPKAKIENDLIFYVEKDDNLIEIHKIVDTGNQDLGNQSKSISHLASISLNKIPLLQSVESFLAMRKVSENKFQLVLRAYLQEDRTTALTERKRLIVNLGLEGEVSENRDRGRDTQVLESGQNLQKLPQISIDEVFVSHEAESDSRFKINHFNLFYHKNSWHEICVTEENSKIEVQVFSSKNEVLWKTKIQNLAKEPGNEEGSEEENEEEEIEEEEGIFGGYDFISESSIHKNYLYLIVDIYITDPGGQESISSTKIIKATLPSSIFASKTAKNQTVDLAELDLETKELTLKHKAVIKQNQDRDELNIICAQVDPAVENENSTLFVLNAELETILTLDFGFCRKIWNFFLVGDKKIYFQAPANSSLEARDGLSFPDLESYLVNLENLKVTRVLDVNGKGYITTKVVGCLEDGFIGIKDREREVEDGEFDLVGIVGSTTDC